MPYICLLRQIYQKAVSTNQHKKYFPNLYELLELYERAINTTASKNMNNTNHHWCWLRRTFECIARTVRNCPESREQRREQGTPASRSTSPLTACRADVAARRAAGWTDCLGSGVGESPDALKQHTVNEHFGLSNTSRFTSNYQWEASTC